MDGFYSNSNPRIQRLNAINGNAPSIHASTEPLFFAANGRGYIDPYASDNMESTLMRYLRSGSPSDGMFTSIENPVQHPHLMGSGGFSSRSPAPLSAMENMVAPMARSLQSSVFRAPVKVEEDVLVMDESPLGRMRSSLLSDSGGVSPSSGHNSYKTEMCRAWEDIGNCRYANKCQFAHGKEELRPTRFLSKNKPEELLCKAYHRTGYCPNGSKCRFFHRTSAPTAAAELTPFDTTTTLTTSSSLAHQKLNIYNSSNNNQGNTVTATGDWLPQDDGIPLMLSSSSSSSSSWTHEKQHTRKDVDAFINGVLYGTSAARRKRLLVFSQICPYDE